MRHKTQQFALQLRRPIQYINPALTRDVARHLYALQDEVDRLTEKSVSFEKKLEKEATEHLDLIGTCTRLRERVLVLEKTGSRVATRNFIGGAAIGFAIGFASLVAFAVAANIIK